MISWIYQKLHRLRVRRRKASAGRVEWEIGGSLLWFDCTDVPLQDSPEAFACLCFAASSLQGWRVNFPGRICPLLGSNLGKIGGYWKRWWRVETGRFKAKRRVTADAGPTGRGTAVFLSLGVDSFYTLLEKPGVDTVVYVAGFDVMLDDVERLEKIDRALRDVGQDRRVKVIFMRTNLREHPVFRVMNWERYHGAALAAAGHLLAGSVGKVVISSSFPKVFFRPWGTTRKTDPLWSSAALEVEHFGDGFWRLEKLGIIADQPVVRDNLRICWEHRNSQMNCGLCEKCLRTMLGLLSLGKLDVYPTFPDASHLVAGLGKAGPLAAHILPTYRGFLERGLPPDVGEAVRELMKRSRAAVRKSRRRK